MDAGLGSAWFRNGVKWKEKGGDGEFEMRRERQVSSMQVSDQLVHADKTGDGSWTEVGYQGTVLRLAGER